MTILSLLLQKKMMRFSLIINVKKMANILDFLLEELIKMRENGIDDFDLLFYAFIILTILVGLILIYIIFYKD